MPAVATIPAQTFRLRTQLLSKGRSHIILAKTKGLHVVIKCYASGGENEFHTHTREDHTFVVLQGQARFHQPDVEPLLLGRNEGILMPAGAYYKFESCGDVPLVMLRVGASSGDDDDDRLDLELKPIPALSAANKHEDPVGIPGAFFE
jgi:mannose-6-phosphate isomerase-like protein (cupin superfamily)